MLEETAEEFPSEKSPTAQTTPTASAVPTDAKAKRAESAADRDLRMVAV